jgi:hypothetical protein
MECCRRWRRASRRVVHYLRVSPEDPERLYVALGHNRGDFRWDAPGHRDLVDQHLMWCLDQRERGWLLPGQVPADNLTIFATTSRGELERVLELDPLVMAGVRRYAVTGCHDGAAEEPDPAPSEAQGSHWLRS